ncbi:peptidoglycan DD-metalloendopeptidase family protein [Microbulbifer sp.]|uniref:peptidoglycan DD-metalloendopeptidase family protein n=1 Tax=Microbulbifer sp. TaxID=1908541 RepID=UPI003F3510E0
MVLLSLLVAACSSPRAPTSALEQPPGIFLDYHTVSRGETLYSIAWRYGRDYRELAAINRIPSPYQIYPGQRLRVTGEAPPAPVTVGKTPAKVKPKPPPVAKAPPKRSKSLTRAAPPKNPGRSSNGSIRWHWPAKGRVISGFRSQDPLRKGVDIAGEKGDSVLAAANGTVIYAGSALRGYGKLLIVKHSEEFLSAYAHNHKLLVQEGSEVKAGQRIAELGSSGTNRNKLHFEIRRNGQPVDPLAYLP